jgi:hypothetical protein
MGRSGSVNLPQSLKGHQLELTQMVNGGVRAECSCGQWVDTTTINEGLIWLRWHRKWARERKLL